VFPTSDIDSIIESIETCKHISSPSSSRFGLLILLYRVACAYCLEAGFIHRWEEEETANSGHTGILHQGTVAHAYVWEDVRDSMLPTREIQSAEEARDCSKHRGQPVDITSYLLHDSSRPMQS
jgi:hypothetical protein